MTFVVTDNCVKCKYTDCVEVCPLIASTKALTFWLLTQTECIDCALCEPECPAEAIFSEDEVPSGQENYLEINAELSQVWPNISRKKILCPMPKNGTVCPTSSSIYSVNLALNKKAAIWLPFYCWYFRLR